MVDASGASIGNAAVTATNTSTNQAFRTTTNEAGNYVIQQLPVGQYELAVEASGFRRYVRRSIELNVAQTLTIDANLEIGQVEQVVEVTADVTTLQTSTSDLGTTIQRTNWLTFRCSWAVHSESRAVHFGCLRREPRAGGRGQGAGGAGAPVASGGAAPVEQGPPRGGPCLRSRRSTRSTLARRLDRRRGLGRGCPCRSWLQVNVDADPAKAGSRPMRSGGPSTISPALPNVRVRGAHDRWPARRQTPKMREPTFAALARASRPARARTPSLGPGCRWE